MPSVRRFSGFRFLTHNPSSFERIVDGKLARAPRFRSNLDLAPDLDHLVARQLEIVADLSALRLTAANSASCQREFSRRNGHLQHAILLMAEQLISLLDLIELEPMGNERS